MERHPAPDPDRTAIEAHAGERVALIAQSFWRVTGGELVRPYGNVPEQLWTMPAVVLAHGAEADPLFFYGNRAALDLFEMTAGELIGLPSRFSAEPVEREERGDLLARVTRDNFIPDYAGIRISKTGRRFMIEGAIVWNLLESDGTIHGQAACFHQWRAVDRV